LLLTVLGVSATWLFGIAVVAAPYRAPLLVIAALCLLGGAGLLWRQQQAAATCGPECRAPGRLRALTLAGRLFGVVLLVAGYVYV
jgi:mercuric ion transport protein